MVTKAITPQMPKQAQYQTQSLMVQQPDEIVEMGQKMATKLKEVITQASLITRIGSSEHIQFEGWQTLGAFFGVTPRTDAVETILNDSKKPHAARAKVSLLDMQGNVVGGAEAICSRGENNWKDKDWFQLESMAQTRAAAKALRMKYSWIVVLAGYNATPAEEMVGISPIENQVKVSAPSANTAHEGVECPDCIREGRNPIGFVRVAKRGTNSRGPWTMRGCTNYPGCDFRSFESLNGIKIVTESVKGNQLEESVDIEQLVEVVE